MRTVGRHNGEGGRGQAIVWVAVMLPLFLSVVGLTIDAGIAFSAHRELQNVADSAARAGAMQIDPEQYRASSGSAVVLDRHAAFQAATQYAAEQGADRATVTVEAQQVTVQVSREVSTSFLRLIGIHTMHIAASAAAQPRHGISQGSR